MRAAEAAKNTADLIAGMGDKIDAGSEFVDQRSKASKQ